MTFLEVIKKVVPICPVSPIEKSTTIKPVIYVEIRLASCANKSVTERERPYYFLPNFKQFLRPQLLDRFRP